MRAWWQMWEKAFVDATCDNLVSAGLELPVRDGVVGFGSETRQDASIRRSKIRWPNRNKRPWEGLVTQLNDMFHEANRNVFGFELWQLAELQFTEYTSEQEGFYGWHQDLNWTAPAEYHRKLSLVMQLSRSEDYEGGNLEVREQPPAVDKLRQRGTVLIFPSFLEHRVTPVTRGRRLSIVAWYSGPKFR